MLESGSKGGLQKNLNYLKSLGNRSKTHLAFFGDYRLAELTNLSGQLNRRCYIAHLPPYPAAMFKEFVKAVAGFEERAKAFGVACDLNSSSTMLFEGSCGCVGLLHRWIVDACIDARHRKAVLNERILRDTMPPDASLAKWRSEIVAGDALMTMLSKRTISVFKP